MRKAVLALTITVPMCAQQGGYSGPAVLSRPGGPSNQRPAPLAFRPYAAVQGLYETGLTPVSVTPEGELPSDASAGVNATLGAYLYHYWKQTAVGLDYRGAYYHYTRNPFFNGTNQVASLFAAHQPSARVALSSSSSFGTYSRAFGGDLGGIYGFQPSSVIQQPGLSALNELFDNRVYFLSTSGDIVYQRTARLSFNAGGTKFYVRRRSSALLGVEGSAARGDIAYRVSRRSTAGVNYQYTRFRFTQSFGGADLHSIGLSYAYSLSRRWEIGVLANAIRLETETLREVAIDPVVAAIIGQQRGVEAFHTVNYVPGAGLRLSRSFRNAGLTLSYTYGVSPGNGLLVTAKNSTASASYSYTGIRRWNLSANAAYSSLSGVGQRLGNYRTVVVGGGFTRSITGWDLHTVGRFDMRQIDTTFPGIPQRWQSRVMLGLSYSPGDIPLSLW
jgi:hypothetical protein